MKKVIVASENPVKVRVAKRAFSSVFPAIGHLTDGLVDRENYYLQAAIIALSELKHQDWYL